MITKITLTCMWVLLVSELYVRKIDRTAELYEDDRVKKVRTLLVAIGFMSFLGVFFGIIGVIWGI